MKSRLGWFMAGALTMAAMAAAWAANKEVVLMSPEDLKWVDVPAPPGAPTNPAGGAQIANVKGDAFKGAYSAFAKIPAGQVHPLHTHTSDAISVVVSGTFTVTPEGGAERKLGPGSYFMIPGGVKHASSCAAGAPCVLFQMGPAKFDVKPVAEKVEKSK